MTLFKLENINGGMNLTRNIADNEVIEALNGFYDEEGIFTKRSGDVAGMTLNASATSISDFESTDAWTLRDTKTDIRTMESGETWTGGTANTASYYSGTQSRKLDGTVTSGYDNIMYSTVSLDLSDATKPYVSYWRSYPYTSASKFDLQLETSSGNYYNQEADDAVMLGTGSSTGYNWLHTTALKSSFTSTGSPSWATITKAQTSVNRLYSIYSQDQIQIDTGVHTEKFSGFVKNGTQSLKIFIGAAVTTTLTKTIDLTGTGATDTITMWVYSNADRTMSASYLRLGLVDDSKYYQVALGALTTGWNYLSVAKSAFTDSGSLGWANITKISIIIGAADTSATGALIFDDLSMQTPSSVVTGITGLYKYYVPSTVSKNVMVAVYSNTTPKDVVAYKNETTGVWTGFTALNATVAQTYFCNAYDRCWFVNGNSTDGLQYIDYQTAGAHPTGTITKTKFATIQPAQVCSDICFVANRIFLLGSANLTTAAGLYNGSTIYYSEPWQSSDASGFAITAWNPEVIEADVGGRGRRIVSVNNNILLFKDATINLIYNLDNNNSDGLIGEIRNKRLTDALGTCAPRSVTPSEIGVIFLDKSGVYSTTISEFKYLSKKIQPIFEGKDTTTFGTSVNYGVNKSYIHLACGAYYKHRFYLSYAAGTSTTNNKTLIYDPLYDAWTITNWGFSCFYVEKGFDTSGYAEEEKLYGGHPTTNYVYRLDYGTDDNGSVIEMLLKTKHFDFRSPERCKTPEKTIVNYISPSAATLTLYLEADYNTGDRETYPIATTASDSTASAKIVMTDYFSRRKYYNITFYNSDKLVNPIKILSLGIEFKMENYL